MLHSGLTKTFNQAKYKMISKNTLHSALINQWSLTEHLKAETRNYFLLQWEGNYVKECNKFGTILRDGIAYLVCFHKCTPHKVYNSPKVWLSFREAEPEWGIPAYVLVQPQITEEIT